MKHYDIEFDQKKRVATHSAKSTASSPTRTITSCGWDAPVPAHRATGTISACPKATSRASATTATVPQLWWIDPAERTRNSERAMGDDVHQAAASGETEVRTGPSTASASQELRPPRNDGVFHPAVPADHPDLHRDHAGCLRRDAVCPGGPVERQIMRFQMAAWPRADGGGRRAGAAATRCPKSRSRKSAATTASTSRCTSGTPSGCGTSSTWISARSYIYQDPVWDVIKSRFPISIFLGLTGFLLSYLVCVPLGVIKAVRHGSRFDFFSSVIVFLGYAVPGWALGTALLVLFGGGSFWSIFPARRIPARQLGISQRVGARSRPAASHVAAGLLLHGRRLCDRDHPHEELADGESRAGLRADGVRQGPERTPRHLRACAAQLADSACHRARPRRSA